MQPPFYDAEEYYIMKRQRNTFLTPLVVEVMASGKQFRLFKQFTYRWNFYHKGFPTGKFPLRVITVPIGFTTDFASIPRFARNLIPKLGKYNKAAVIHDYLYSVKITTRKGADKCFRDGMKDLGVVKWKRTLMYFAVRLFGGFAWRKR